MGKNTGLGLIGSTLERVQNEDSLYYSALKRLNNSSEEEIREYLKMPNLHAPKSILRRIIMEGETPKIRPLSGKKLLFDYDCLNINLSGIRNLGLSENYVSTPETAIRLDKVVTRGTIKQVFNSLPGVWSQKWFSQNQVGQTCEDFGYLLPPADNAVVILCKKDEKLPIDQDNFTENLIILSLVPRASGFINVYYVSFETKIITENTLVLSPL